MVFNLMALTVERKCCVGSSLGHELEYGLSSGADSRSAHMFSEAKFSKCSSCARSYACSGPAGLVLMSRVLPNRLKSDLQMKPICQKKLIAVRKNLVRSFLPLVEAIPQEKGL